jgi:hypothetical protein
MKSWNILLYSDLHWLTVPVGQQLGQYQMGQFARFVERVVIDHWKRENMRRMLITIDAYSHRGPYDLAISTGDDIETQFNERGLRTKVDMVMAELFLKLFSSLVIKRKKMYFIQSDHNCGYRLPMQYDPRGGISQASLENFEKVYGPPFKSFRLGKIRFILLSSPLLMQPFEGRQTDERKSIGNLKRKQEYFLKMVLMNIGSDEKVLIFLHDPDSIQKIDEIIPDELKAKITKIFSGHMHASWVPKVYLWMGWLSKRKSLIRFISKHRIGKNIAEWARGNMARYELFQKYGHQVIPSPGGMMGLGKGFLTLRIWEDGNWEVKEHKI